MVECKYCGKETNRKKFCNRECLEKWRVGKTNVEMWGEEKAKQCREKQSKKATGKPSKLKGRTYEDIHGEEKARKLREDRFKNSDRCTRKGKTYEEIYGEEEAKRLRKLRSETMLRSHRHGKSRKISCEVCGREIRARGMSSHMACHDGTFWTPSRVCCALGNSRVKSSFPQRKLCEVVKEKFGDAELNYFVRTNVGARFLDVAVVSKMLDFEYDGEYWHKDKEKDRKRDEELREVGWKVIRVAKGDNFIKIVEQSFGGQL